MLFLLNRANKLTIVAASIGKARVISELIPYIPCLITTPSDEVLVAVGRQLYNIWDICNAPSSLTEDHIKVFFNCLRQLGEEEEVVVRQSVVASFSKIIPTVTEATITSIVLPLFRSFAANDLFGARHTAASLLPVVYRYAPADTREEIRVILNALATDETPMVRRVIATVLPQFCQAVSDLVADGPYSQQLEAYELLRMNVIPVIQQIAVDERDYLRDLAPQAITGLIPHIPLDLYQDFLLPLVTGLAEDISWKIRQNLCFQCPLLIATLLRRTTFQYQKEALFAYETEAEIQKFRESMVVAGGALELNKFLGQIFNVFTNLLLHDSNMEVRSIGVLTLVDMVYLAKGVVPSDLFDKTQRVSSYSSGDVEQDELTLNLHLPTATPPHLKKTFTKPAPSNTVFTIDHQNAIDTIGAGFNSLAREISTLSKVDLCEVFGILAPLVTPDYVQRYITPVVNVLALDDHLQVRSTILLCLEPIIATSSPDVIKTQIWPVVEQLATDTRWRVRRAAASQITSICYHLKTETEFLETNVVPLIGALLTENVHAVRNRIAVEFRAIVFYLGIQFVAKNFVEIVSELFDKDSNYLFRITALHFIYFTSIGYENSCPASFIATNFTPILLSALEDNVLNMKILATRYIIALIQTVPGIWDKKFIQEKILPSFQSMSKGTDRELILQSQNAIKAVEALK